MHMKDVNILAESGDYAVALDRIQKGIVEPIAAFLKDYGFEFNEDSPATRNDCTAESWAYHRSGCDFAVVICWSVEEQHCVYVTLHKMEDPGNEDFHWSRAVLATMQIFDTDQVHPCPREWLKQQLVQRGYFDLTGLDSDDLFFQHVDKLFEALEKRDWRFVKWLLVDQEGSPGTGYTIPIDFTRQAVADGQWEVAKALIEIYYDCNCREAEGISAGAGGKECLHLVGEALDSQMDSIMRVYSIIRPFLQQS